MPSNAPLGTVLEQMRSNALLVRAVKLCASADTLTEGRVALQKFAFALSYPDLELLFVNAIESLTLKMVETCPDKAEFLHAMDTLTGVIGRVIEEEVTR